MFKQIQNYINFLIVCNICFIHADPGCTDSEAYNCVDDAVWSNYIFDIGGIMYDNSCNWDWNTGTGEADYVGGCEASPCEGYYDPDAGNDDGSCRYPQAPHGAEVVFNLTPAINVNWSAFSPPENAILESYHVQRCVGTGCTWIGGFAIGDVNTNTQFSDDYAFEIDEEIKYAIAVKYSNNPYWGWAIGASYITPPDIGDVNGDNLFNVLDIVALANCVLSDTCDILEFSYACDLNGDGNFNVLDIVALANCVLGSLCGGRVDDANESHLIMNGHIASIEADGFIGGVQMTLIHGSDFKIDMTDWALLADYITEGNETRLLVITPETNKLFSYSGDFKITEIIVANSYAEVPVELPEGNEISNDLYISTIGIIEAFSLSAAYPNPFNPITMMTLAVPTSGHVSVQVYNLSGQVVATLANEYMDSNTYNTLSWDATDTPSGMYFVKAQAFEFTTTHKLMLVK